MLQLICVSLGCVLFVFAFYWGALSLLDISTKRRARVRVRRVAGLDKAAQKSDWIHDEKPKSGFARAKHKRLQKKTRDEIERELPVLLEVLALGMSAGLSFDAALDVYCSRFSSCLSDHMKDASAQWKFTGASRAEVLHRLARAYESSDFDRFCDVVIRSGKFGNAIGKDLVSLANELRRSQKRRLEEKTAKVPVKMLIPLGTMILPSMLLLVLGPVVVSFV